MSVALSEHFHPFQGSLYFLNFVLFGTRRRHGGRHRRNFSSVFPSLRLKGDYLAIVTLGFGEIIRVIFS